MSEGNVEVVRSMLDAWNRGDYERALEFISSEITVESDLGASFWSAFADFRTEVERYIPVDDHVVIEARHFGRGRGSGAEVEMRNWQVVTVSNGKVARYRLFTTERDALEAVGLAEPR